jgi:hypothetical protein
MNKEQWQKGIEAWTRIKTQALIDIEQAELYIQAIEQKIKEVK